MTTIACNEYGMACDSMQHGNYIDRISIKKIFEINGCLVGVAGNPGYMKQFLNWYRTQRHEFPELGEDFAALESTPDGQCFYWDSIGVPQEVGFPAAIGSGANIAIGAMMAGATPSQAVRIAMELDMSTGGDLYILGKMKKGGA